MDFATYDAARKTVDLPSGTVSYVETGQGPVALFVHGVLVNGFLFRHQLDALADRRRCIAIDLFGHGRSAAAPGQDVSFDGHAQMLAQFLDALDIDTVDLIANDSGTGIAQVFAVGHPARLRSLTLSNGDVHDNWPPKDFAGFLQMVAEGGLADTVAGMSRDKDLFRSADGLGGAYQNPDAVSDDTVEAYLAPLLADPSRIADLERFILDFDHAQTVRIEPDLRALEVPTLIVWGTGDIFFDTAWSHWLATTIPGTRNRVELGGAALLLPEERAEEFTSVLAAHLAATS